MEINGTGWGKLDCIGQQISQHLLQFICVTFYCKGGFFMFRIKNQPLGIRFSGKFV